MTKEIENIEDIQLLVNSFYAKIREDDQLGDIFNERIKCLPTSFTIDL